MAFTYSTIPSNKLVPGNYTETNQNRASQGTSVRPRRLVVVGHRNTTGAVAAGVPFRVFSEADAETNAGISMLSESLRVAKKAYPSLELWGIGLAPGGGAVAATGIFAITGPATAAGTAVFYVAPYWMGSELRGRYAISVASADTATTI